MFWKKKNDEPTIEYQFSVMIYGEIHKVDRETYNYIDKLRYENARLENELNAIKPILEKNKYDPPRSKDCSDCRYVVKSPWDKAPIGCRKNMVCESFEKEE